MTESGELRKLQKQKFDAYQVAKANLIKVQDDPVALSLAAQEANQAWLDFKEADRAFANCSIMKKLGDLYGC